MKHLANFIQAQRSVWCNAIYSGTRVRLGTRPNEVFFKCLLREKYDKSKDETEKEIFIAKKGFTYESLSTKELLCGPLVTLAS